VSTRTDGVRSSFDPAEEVLAEGGCTQKVSSAPRVHFPSHSGDSRGSALAHPPAPPCRETTARQHDEISSPFPPGPPHASRQESHPDAVPGSASCRSFPGVSRSVGSVDDTMRGREKWITESCKRLCPHQGSRWGQPARKARRPLVVLTTFRRGRSAGSAGCIPEPSSIYRLTRDMPRRRGPRPQVARSLLMRDLVLWDRLRAAWRDQRGDQKETRNGARSHTYRVLGALARPGARVGLAPFPLR
jgi:hypothetical protein